MIVKYIYLNPAFVQLISTLVESHGFFHALTSSSWTLQFPDLDEWTMFTRNLHFFGRKLMASVSQSIEHRTAPRNPSTAASSHDPPKRAWCGKIAGGMVTVSWRVIFRIIIPNIPHVFVLRCFLNDVTFPRNCRNWYFWTPCYPICSNLWIESSTQILIAIEGLLHWHVWLQEGTNLSPWYQW